MLNPPGNLPVRPTTDFAKTGLFNILESRYDLENKKALDLFSGTGSISFELISRNCSEVTSVDMDYGCIAFQKETARQLDIHNLRIIRSDVMTFIKKPHTPSHFIFADPPYALQVHERLIETITTGELLEPDGVLILEHVSRQHWNQFPGFLFERSYGNVAFSFFSKFVPKETT